MRGVNLTFAEGGDHADPAAVRVGLMTFNVEWKELPETQKVRMFALRPDILTWYRQVECHPDSLWIYLTCPTWQRAFAYVHWSTAVS